MPEYFALPTQEQAQSAWRRATSDVVARRSQRRQAHLLCRLDDSEYIADAVMQATRSALEIREIELALFEIRYCTALGSELLDIEDHVSREILREVLTDRLLFFGEVDNVLYLGVSANKNAVEEAVASPMWRLPELIAARRSDRSAGST
jgi:hypothetical protein